MRNREFAPSNEELQPRVTPSATPGAAAAAHAMGPVPAVSIASRAASSASGSGSGSGKTNGTGTGTGTAKGTGSGSASAAGAGSTNQNAPGTGSGAILVGGGAISIGAAGAIAGASAAISPPGVAGAIAGASAAVTTAAAGGSNPDADIMSALEDAVLDPNSNLSPQQIGDLMDALSPPVRPDLPPDDPETEILDMLTPAPATNPDQDLALQIQQGQDAVGAAIINSLPPPDVIDINNGFVAPPDDPEPYTGDIS
jgi:hypothetical protein